MDAGAKKATTQGWLEIIKNKLENFAQQFEFSWAKITEYGAALGAGIVIGFLVKRFGRLVILTFIVFAAFLAILAYFDLILIDWIKVKEFVGFPPTDTIEAFFKEYLKWAQAHIITVIISILGFIIGYKIG